MRARVFIGSSKKDIKYARAIARLLESANVTALRWWDHSVFPHGKTLIESLELAVRTSNAAILVAGPDDAIQKPGGQTVWQPRDNVIFEYGMFVAMHGRERVALATIHGSAELPSDIGGVLQIQLVPPDVPDDDPTFDTQFEQRNREEIMAWLAPLIDETEDGFSLEKCPTVVGDIDMLIHACLSSKIAKATQIDMMSSYRPVSNVYRYLGKFGQVGTNRLRVCFGNQWDVELARAYGRKTQRDPTRMQDAVKESIGRFLGDGVDIDATDPANVRVTGTTSCKADYRIYLTPQRVTYTYCRVGDVAMVAPLDMKKAATPRPMGWLLRRDHAPEAFAYYEHDFETMLAEGQCIYGK